MSNTVVNRSSGIISRRIGKLNRLASRRLAFHRRLRPYLYLLPALVTIGLWIYRPLAQVLELSFYQWNLLPTSPKSFVAFENYRQILILPEFGVAVRNTVGYVVGILPMSIAIPLVVALQTNRLPKKAKRVYQTVVFTPVIIAPVVITILWRWLLSPFGGFVNTFIFEPLFGEPVSFFGQSYAIYTIMGMAGWGIIGFSTLIFSAALTNVDRSYVEAAAIEGATYRQMSLRVLLPLVSPTIIFMTLLTILFASQWTFVHINVLTQNAPYMHVTNVYHLLFVYGFRSFNIGWSSASAVILFVVFSIVAMIFLRLSNRFAFYEE